MTKLIQFTLSKITYRGDSIGDDIRVEIEILGKFLRLDKRIQPRSTSFINEVIGQIETDRNLFDVIVEIHLIEKDILFNDVGSRTGKIKVDTTTTKAQRFTYEIEIRETRSVFGNIWGKRRANFELTLEARVMDSVRYVPDEDGGKGWLRVILEDDKSEQSLPAYLQVKPQYIESGREYFMILEGPYRGQLASVALKDGGSSWFILGVVHKPMARALYSISQKAFVLNGKKYTTVDYPDSPWQKGVYDIEIPDYPHEGGRNYLSKSKRAMHWFRIGHSGERYLHTGTHSLGCMTITEVNRWMEIYNALIKARKDFSSVGVLEVVD